VVLDARVWLSPRSQPDARLRGDARRRDGGVQKIVGAVIGGGVATMTRTELIIQLVKIVIGVAFGAYFLWWSVQVLDRLPLPE
jgi:hypothetical protein